jgi:hypothetical protein
LSPRRSGVTEGSGETVRVLPFEFQLPLEKQSQVVAERILQVWARFWRDREQVMSFRDLHVISIHSSNIYMRVFGVLILAAMACNAQDSRQSLPDPEIIRLQSLADQVKDAVAVDMAKANRLAKELGVGVSRREKVLYVAELEMQLPYSGPDRITKFSQSALAASDAADYDRAESKARELLAMAESDPKDPLYGHAIYYGNLVLGRVALGRDHDVVKAKEALLAAGKSHGSAVLNSFGPNMSLAKELLEAGERDSVLEFFDECRSFWRMGKAKLDAWSADIKGCCRLPHFGANLVY